MNDAPQPTTARPARRPIPIAPATIVRERPGVTDGAPRVFEADPAAAVDLVSWVAANQASVDERLAAEGGVLFRGFDVGGLATFERIARALCGELMQYTYRSTPRTKVAEGIYTSTEYPPDQKIPQHNENAYANRWPLRIAFACVEPSPSGGETPTADSRRVYARIPESVRERFAAHGVMYVRNYHRSIDLPWQEVFQTSERSEVEALCHDMNIAAEWQPDGGLRTTQVCQAIARHPRSGDRVWFNQAHLFHLSALSPHLRECLIDSFGIANVPRNALYGDGTPIEDEVVADIRQIYEDEEVGAPWQRGDVMLLDNMLRSHGRLPFKGPRRVLVGMGGMIGDDRPAETVHV
jgi:alpha-ketoglutarate-dependent taurine dioxygenase